MNAERQTPSLKSRQNASKAEPFLRWAGGKRKQVSTLAKFWKPEFARYVEPFMGSACLYFALNPSHAVLSDINHDLVQTFLAVRDHPQAVANRIEKIPLGETSYYSIRKSGLANLDNITAAARFIFLNRFCFNGLYRTNVAGKFNVPYAPARTGKLATAESLRLISKVLQRATIEHSDFERTLGKTKSGDFVYLDPPYAVSNRRIFRQYGPDSFGLNDLQRLSASLNSMDKRGVFFLLSYADCTEVETFFNAWPHRQIYIQRNISGFTKHRGQAAEILVSNCFPTDFPATR